MLKEDRGINYLLGGDDSDNSDTDSKRSMHYSKSMTVFLKLDL